MLTNLNQECFISSKYGGEWKIDIALEHFKLPHCSWRTAAVYQQLSTYFWLLVSGCEGVALARRQRLALWYKPASLNCWDQERGNKEQAQDYGRVLSVVPHNHTLPPVVNREEGNTGDDTSVNIRDRIMNGLWVDRVYMGELGLITLPPNRQ